MTIKLVITYNWQLLSLDVLYKYLSFLFFSVSLHSGCDQLYFYASLFFDKKKKKDDSQLVVVTSTSSATHIAI